MAFRHFDNVLTEYACVITTFDSIIIFHCSNSCNIETPFAEMISCKCKLNVGCILDYKVQKDKHEFGYSSYKQWTNCLSLSPSSGDSGAVYVVKSRKSI